MVLLLILGLPVAVFGLVAYAIRQIKKGKKGWV